jgi:hypothetical protein
MGWAGACIEDIRNVEQPNKNGNTRKDNIKMDLSEVCCGGVDCIHLVKDREQRQIFVNIIVNF